MFTIEQSQPDLVVLTGRFDAAQVDKAEQVLGSLEASTTLDLASLEYISSAGIGCLLRAYKRLTASGHQLRLVHARPHVRNIFHYSGLDQILSVE